MKTIVILAWLLPMVVMGCPLGETQAFHCVTIKGKPVQICQAKDTVNYRFGGRPDLEIKVPNGQLKWRTGNGSGAFFNELTFPKGNTLYQVLYTESFKGPPHRDAEIQVYREGTQLADVQCSGGSASFNPSVLKAKISNY